VFVFFRPGVFFGWVVVRGWGGGGGGGCNLVCFVNDA